MTAILRSGQAYLYFDIKNERNGKQRVTVDYTHFPLLTKSERNAMIKLLQMQVELLKQAQIFKMDVIL